MMNQRVVEALEKNKHKFYRQLIDGYVKVDLSENVMKCPYCPDSRTFCNEEDLFRHAARIARESKSAGFIDKAKHMALMDFIKQVSNKTDCDMDMDVGLDSLLEEMCRRSEQLQCQIGKKDAHMANVMNQKEMIIRNFNRDIRFLQEKADKKVKKIITEQSKMNGQDKMLKLVDDQKKEIEKLEKQVTELQKKVDDKENLELKIHQMKEDIGVMKNLTDENVESKKKLENILEELKETKVELEDSQQLNTTLTVKELLSNDELQDARKELISGLKEFPHASRAIVGVKRLGELDKKPFLEAAKRYKDDCKVGGQYGTHQVSLWEERIRDPNWHPFKVVTTEGESKEVIDEDDEKLASLKAEQGDEVYKAVVTAMKELNECNPSGRCPLLELWNNRDKRKATLKEGIQYLLRQAKSKRQRVQEED